MSYCFKLVETLGAVLVAVGVSEAGLVPGQVVGDGHRVHDVH